MPIMMDYTITGKVAPDNTRESNSSYQYWLLGGHESSDPWTIDVFSDTKGLMLGYAKDTDQRDILIPNYSDSVNGLCPDNIQMFYAPGSFKIGGSATYKNKIQGFMCPQIAVAGVLNGLIKLRFRITAYSNQEGNALGNLRQYVTLFPDKEGGHSTETTSRLFDNTNRSTKLFLIGYYDMAAGCGTTNYLTTDYREITLPMDTNAGELLKFAEFSNFEEFYKANSDIVPVEGGTLDSEKYEKQTIPAGTIVRYQIKATSRKFLQTQIFVVPTINQFEGGILPIQLNINKGGRNAVPPIDADKDAVVGYYCSNGSFSRGTTAKKICGDDTTLSEAQQAAVLRSIPFKTLYIPYPACASILNPPSNFIISHETYNGIEILETSKSDDGDYRILNGSDITLSWAKPQASAITQITGYKIGYHFDDDPETTIYWSDDIEGEDVLIGKFEKINCIGKSKICFYIQTINSSVSSASSSYVKTQFYNIVYPLNISEKVGISYIKYQVQNSDINKYFDINLDSSSITSSQDTNVLAKIKLNYRTYDSSSSSGFLSITYNVNSLEKTSEGQYIIKAPRCLAGKIGEYNLVAIGSCGEEYSLCETFKVNFADLSMKTGYTFKLTDSNGQELDLFTSGFYAKITTPEKNVEIDDGDDDKLSIKYKISYAYQKDGNGNWEWENKMSVDSEEDLESGITELFLSDYLSNKDESYGYENYFSFYPYLYYTQNNQEYLISSEQQYVCENGIFRGLKPDTSDITIKIQNCNIIDKFSEQVPLSDFTIQRIITQEEGEEKIEIITSESDITKKQLSNKFEVQICFGALPNDSSGQEEQLKFYIQAGSATDSNNLLIGEATLTVPKDESGTLCSDWVEVNLHNPTSGGTLIDYSGFTIKILGKTYNIINVNDKTIKIQKDSEDYDIDFSDTDNKAAILNKAFNLSATSITKLDTLTYDYNKDGIEIDSSTGERILPENTEFEQAKIGDFLISGDGGETDDYTSYNNNSISIEKYEGESDEGDVWKPIEYYSDNQKSYYVMDVGKTEENAGNLNEGSILYPDYDSRNIQIILNAHSKEIYPSSINLETDYGVKELKFRIVTYNKFGVKNIIYKDKQNTPFSFKINLTGTIQPLLIDTNGHICLYDTSEEVKTYSINGDTNIKAINIKSIVGSCFASSGNEVVEDSSSYLLIKFRPFYDPSYAAYWNEDKTSLKYRYTGFKLNSSESDPLSYTVVKFINTSNGTQKRNSFSLTEEDLLYIDGYYYARVKVYLDGEYDELAYYGIEAKNKFNNNSLTFGTTINIEDQERIASNSDDIKNIFICGIQKPDIRFGLLSRTTEKRPEDADEAQIWTDYKLFVINNGFGKGFKNTLYTTNDDYLGPYDSLEILGTKTNTQNNESVNIIESQSKTNPYVNIKEVFATAYDTSFIFPITSSSPYPGSSNFKYYILDSLYESSKSLTTENKNSYNFLLQSKLTTKIYTVQKNESNTAWVKEEKLVYLKNSYTTYLPVAFATMSLRRNRVGINQDDLKGYEESLLVFPKHRIDDTYWPNSFDISNTEPMTYYPNVLSIGGDTNTRMPQYNGSNFNYSSGSYQSGAFMGFYINADTENPRWAGSFGFGEDYKPYVVYGKEGRRIKASLTQTAQITPELNTDNDCKIYDESFEEDSIVLIDINTDDPQTIRDYSLSNFITEQVHTTAEYTVPDQTKLDKLLQALGNTLDEFNQLNNTSFEEDELVSTDIGAGEKYTYYNYSTGKYGIYFKKLNTTSEISTTLFPLKITIIN